MREGARVRVRTRLEKGKGQSIRGRIALEEEGRPIERGGVGVNGHLEVKGIKGATRARQGQLGQRCCEGILRGWQGQGHNEVMEIS